MAAAPAAAPAPTVRIPQYLWDSLEVALTIQATAFVKEAAKKLKVPEKDLLARVLPKGEKMVQAVLAPEEERRACQALVPFKAVAGRCGRHVEEGQQYCTYHVHHRPKLLHRLGSIRVTRLKTERTDLPPLWLLPGDDRRMVIDEAGHFTGVFHTEEGRLELFVQKGK